ncbi:MAG: NAD(P)-binding protein, partial [Phycisphaerales bacterium]
MRYDLAILGSGFGGSITALIANQMGMRTVLIEKGSHPRFATGESSTPQADIALATIADTYNLPRLKPLARYGSWKEAYPELNCGPKRGFTYIHHPNIT